MTYLCLSVAAAGLGFLIGSDFGFKRGVRIGRELERDAEMLKPNYWMDLAAQRAKDRLAVDSLVGSATYRGDE